MRSTKRGFTLLEILITIVILTAGVVAITRAFSIGILASSDVENVALALNIAQAKMEEIKDTDFASISDSGPAPDANFPNFNLTVDAAEGDNPMQVTATVSWKAKGGEANVALTTLVADY